MINYILYVYPQKKCKEIADNSRILKSCLKDIPKPMFDNIYKIRFKWVTQNQINNIEEIRINYMRLRKDFFILVKWIVKNKRWISIVIKDETDVIYDEDDDDDDDEDR